MDWRPWAEDAFKKAEKEDKPIFLSIGYSTCHWCHVMERESFEDEEIASIMNEHFINIKVDREERPDIDHIYMTAIQMMGYGGGWPLSAFLTPDKKPFFGGSYFPPQDRPGTPGFTSVLQAVAWAWKTKRQELIKHSESVLGFLASESPKDGTRPGEEALLKAAAQLAGQYDREFGGFSDAVKFPMGHKLSFLLRVWHRFKDKSALSMVTHTLDRLSLGGIYDHLGGGFHRYSTERAWLIPHFEKMLYDQALLAQAYTDAFLVTRKQDYRRIVREILAYVSDNMEHADGGFYSAEDADTEGSEGKFYLWTMRELIEELGEDVGGLFCRYYGVTREGNFEGRNILAVRRGPEEFARNEGIAPVELASVLEACSVKLRAVRDRRIRPFRDDKILTDWNGLMISAFAYASRALHIPEYAKTSSKAAEFILSHCRSGGGRLMKRWRGGEAGGPGLLADYAFFCNGLIDVYEATFEPVWLMEALEIAHDMARMFGDHAAGGFFTGPKDGEKLVLNPKEIFDGAIPSGNSVALMVVMRLAHITGDAALEEIVEPSFKSFGKEIEALPSALPCMMTALDYHLGPRREVVIAPGKSEEEAEALITEVHGRFSPRTVVLLHPGNEDSGLLETVAPFIKNLTARDEKTTLYICENFTCALPATGAAEALRLLDERL